MKRMICALLVFSISPSLCLAAGPWRVTETVDSQWAGTVQVKWNSITGESFHSVGHGGSHTTWLSVLTHLAWTEIANPAGGWKSGPAAEGRYIVRPHVVFGRDDTYSNRRAGVFMIDTYTGACYVAAKIDEYTAIENLLYHDEVRDSYWVQIEEAADLSSPPTSEVGRYEISAVNSTYPLPDGRLGPYVTRLDRVTGRVDVAIPKALLVSGSSVAEFVWYPILNSDPG